MYRAVTSNEIAAYQQLVESLAMRYRNYPEADYDDLVQEGLISVWECLRRGNRPAAQVLQWNMLRWLAAQRRLRRGDAVAGMYLSLTPEWQEEFGTVLSGLDPWASREVPGTDASP